jgi:hypothetical protein
MRRRLSRAAKKKPHPKTKLGLPDLDQAKAAVLGSLRSPESQRGYQHSINESSAGIVPNLACPLTRLSSPGTESTSRVVY